MARQSTFSLLAFFLAFSLFGGIAFAGGVQYRAEPAAAPPAARFIVKGVVWRCGSGGCGASQGNSRPAVDCPALVRKVGALLSFTVGGRPFDSAELGKCNARAR